MDVTMNAMRTLLLAGLATLVASSGGAQVPLTLDTTFRCTQILYPGHSDAMPLVDGSVVVTGRHNAACPLSDLPCCRLPLLPWSMPPSGVWPGFR